MLPREDMTPVIRTDVPGAYGDDLTSLLGEITAAIPADALQQMKGEASGGRPPLRSRATCCRTTWVSARRDVPRPV